jgi:hypothetical protein
LEAEILVKVELRFLDRLSAELTSFMVHQEVNVTMYLKDVYVQDDSLYIVNITQLNIRSHPDYSEADRRAVVIPTEFEQPGISQKARFHVLQSIQFPLLVALATGSFSDQEMFQISTKTSNL